VLSVAALSPAHAQWTAGPVTYFYFPTDDNTTSATSGSAVATSKSANKANAGTSGDWIQSQPYGGSSGRIGNTHRQYYVWDGSPVLLNVVATQHITLSYNVTGSGNAGAEGHIDGEAAGAVTLSDKTSSPYSNPRTVFTVPERQGNFYVDCYIRSYSWGGWYGSNGSYTSSAATWVTYAIQ
jgi:hypothetical protein